jgi:hypothetical protein
VEKMEDEGDGGVENSVLEQLALLGGDGRRWRKRKELALGHSWSVIG